MPRETRVDFAERIGKVRKTAQGFLRIPATLTRTGVLTYRRADGTVVRELRPADEVARADSVASLGGAPVTDMHPDNFVSPDNYRSFSKGFVSERIDYRDGFLQADVIVQDRKLIEAIEKKERKEISPGYSVRIDATPGVYEGQAYDQVQRDIVYNHLAIGPSGWGRSGSEVSLRLDGGDDNYAVEVREDMADDEPPKTKTKEPEREMPLAKIRIDNADVEVAETSKVAVESAFATRDNTIAELGSKVAELTAEVAKLSDPKVRQDEIDARVALVSAAKRFVDQDFAGKSSREIMLAAIAAKHPAADMSARSDEYVQARFDALCEAVPAEEKKQPSDAIKKVLDVVTGDKVRNDAADAVHEARRKMIEGIRAGQV